MILLALSAGWVMITIFFYVVLATPLIAVIISAWLRLRDSQATQPSRGTDQQQ